MGDRKVFNFTKQDSIKIIMQITSKDDPYWSNLVEDYYDEKTDSMPTIYEVLEPLGISKKEIDESY